MPRPDQETNMTSRFEHLLIDIATHELGARPDADVIAKIHDILEEDGLDSDDQVPEWIGHMFQSLHDRKPVPLRDQPDPTTDADVGEFFADLQAVDAFDCHDHGEWVRIRLPRHGMLGFFSVENACYTVEKLDDVPDDGASDLSAAKLYDR
jgi:hypothetical protein